GEMKEVPFVIAWHFPTYEVGPFAGRSRYYSQFLGKFRPDNAIVWLAEEVVRNYGTESATYKHWISQIQDWHEAVLSNPAYPTKEHCSRINKLSALLQSGISFSANGQVSVADMDGLRAILQETEPVRAMWPNLAAGLFFDRNP